MRIILSILLGGCFIFLLSCSKEKSKTYAELILGKWTIVNEIVKEKSSGLSDTMTYSAQSSLDFSSNGAVVIKVDDDENGTIEPDETQASTYLLENSNLTFGMSDSTTYIIKTLTNSNFSFQSDDDGYEITINLKR